MPELSFENHVYQVDDFDTVLNTLLKNGHAVPNFCRGGICHSCMMKAEVGTPLAFTQIGLSEDLVAENYFLTCQCAVFAPMSIRRPDKDKRTRFVAMVHGKHALSPGVVRLLLRPTHEFVYQAGQYTTLINVDGLADDFPIASVHGGDGLMEFHIADQRQKPLSHYIVNRLEVGEGLEIQTALGDCYYGDALKGRDLAVVGVDTGMASGLSLIKKALQENHQGAIDIVCGRLGVEQSYFDTVIEAAIGSAESVSTRIVAADSEDALLSAIKNRLDELPPSRLRVILVAAEPVLARRIIASCGGGAAFSLSPGVE